MNYMKYSWNIQLQDGLTSEQLSSNDFTATVLGEEVIASVLNTMY